MLTSMPNHTQKRTYHAVLIVYTILIIRAFMQGLWFMTMSAQALQSSSINPMWMNFDSSQFSYRLCSLSAIILFQTCGNEHIWYVSYFQKCIKFKYKTANMFEVFSAVHSLIAAHDCALFSVRWDAILDRSSAWIRQLWVWSIWPDTTVCQITRSYHQLHGGQWKTYHDMSMSNHRARFA